MPEHDNNDTQEKKQWQETSGFAADTMMVHITAPESQVDDWDTEAEEAGFNNRSDYLRALIGEARAYRQNDVRGPQQAEQRIQELQSEVDRLQDELEQERRKSGGRPAIDDVDFLERFLTDNYQPLPDILQQIVESGVLNDLIRKRVEDQLYFMAQQGRVQFERGWGWKLAEEDNGGGA